MSRTCENCQINIKKYFHQLSCQHVICVDCFGYFLQKILQEKKKLFCPRCKIISNSTHQFQISNKGQIIQKKIHYLDQDTINKKIKNKKYYQNVSKSKLKIQRKQQQKNQQQKSQLKQKEFNYDQDYQNENQQSFHSSKHHNYPNENQQGDLHQHSYQEQFYKMKKAYERQSQEMKIQFKQMKNAYERQIYKLKHQIQKLSKLKQEEVAKINWVGTINKFQEIKLKNSEQQKQMFTATDWLKKIHLERQSKRLSYLQKQNQTIKNWLEIFFESLNKICKIRLQKLRSNDGDVRFIQRKFPKINLKTILNFQNPQFPYYQLLCEFQKIVKDCDQIKIQNEKYKQQKKSLMINKQLIKQILNQALKFHSKIVEQFKICGQKRQETALFYQNLSYDHETSQLMNETTLQNLVKSQSNSNQLLNKINNQILDLQKNQKFIKQNLCQPQHQIIKEKIKVHSKFTKLLRDVQNYNERNGLEPQFIQELKQKDQTHFQKRQIKQPRQQKSYEENQSSYQKQLKEYRKFQKEAKELIQKMVKSTNQQAKFLKAIQQKNANKLKQMRQDLEKPQFIYQQKSYNQQRVQQNFGSNQHNRIQEKQSFSFAKPNYSNSSQLRLFSQHKQHQNGRKNIFVNQLFSPKRQNYNNQEINESQSQSQKQWEI